MISAPIGKAIDFPAARQNAQRPAAKRGWLARISQRLERRRQAEANCFVH